MKTNTNTRSSRSALRLPRVLQQHADDDDDDDDGRPWRNTSR